MSVPKEFYKKGKVEVGEKRYTYFLFPFLNIMNITPVYKCQEITFRNTEVSKQFGTGACI